MSVIAINNVGLDINQVSLLDTINLQVEAGQIVAILGPNGAGKTSLLKVITGELAATRGEVLINARSNLDWPRQQLAQFMGVLPQQSLLNFPFTVAEVVSLGRTPHDTGVSRDKEICREALQTVDCLHLRDRLYTQLSGGEKQRVQLARILAQIWEANTLGERLLILDEPTSSLDLAHQQQILEAVTDFSRQGCAVIVVLHDLNLAARFANKIVLLSCGRITAQGTPEEVFQPSVIEKVFAVKVDIIRHPKTGAPVVLG